MWHIYTMEYYSAIKRNKIELFVVRWMDLVSVTQSEASQKEINIYHMLTHTHTHIYIYVYIYIYIYIYTYIYGIKTQKCSEEPRGRTGIKMQT